MGSFGAVTLPLLILRPQPGNDATAARARDLGLSVVQAPLFAPAALSWDAPEAAAFDALLLTSANALRYGGRGLDHYRPLPTGCVGTATADAARAAGFAVTWVGDRDGDSLLDSLSRSTPMPNHIVWLCGAEHSALTVPDGMTLLPVPVYQAAEAPVDPAKLPLEAVVMLHSSRAATRFRALVDDPSRYVLVPISAKVAAAAGPGWRDVQFPDSPDDSKMVAIAAKLCHEQPPRVQRR